MRSSERWTRWGSALASWGVVAAAVGGVATFRADLAAAYHTVRVAEDVYPLPAPEVTIVASLGHRSALADIIYGHVLVSYGLHFQEKRRFEFVADYLRTIAALDPTFAEPMRFADTLIVMAPVPPRQEDYAAAKEVLEVALRNLPYDTQLWLTSGQFMAYLAPPYLENPEWKAAWRKRGGEVLARTCELVDDNENVPYHCITAAKLLDRAGEREAAIQSLQRILAVNDDPEIERMALGYLSKVLDEREGELQEARRDAFRAAWKGEMPFLSKDAVLVLGPRVDTARCAGFGHDDDPACDVTWAAWSARIEHAQPVTGEQRHAPD